MDIQYLKEITNALSAFMKDNGFSSEGLELGNFKGEFKSYRIAYDESKKLFSISVAPVDSENYTVLSTWFFDENDHGAKDIACIGEDFTEAVAKDAGIKIVKANEVIMPEKAAAGTEPDIKAFTQKFLAMFPQYKDAYKDSVAKYGDFMYVDFYKRYGIEKMRELMSDEGLNKKQLVKYWNMLGDMHYEGELIVGDIICTVILAGTFGSDPARFDAAAEKYLAEYPFLKSAAKAAVHDYKNNKKLRKIIEG